MADKIRGITIEIGGNTTKLSQSLKQANSTIADTQKQLKDVNKLLKLDPGNITLLNQKHELLGKSISAANTKLEEEKKLYAQLKAEGDTGKNREQMQALERDIISTTEELKNLNKQYGNALTPALQSVSNATGKMSEQTRGLSTAAAAGAAGLVGMTIAAGKTADDINTIAKQTGFSTEELQKMKYASDLIDVSMETMSGSIKKLTSNMANGNEAFDKLGVSVTNQDGTMRNATDVWFDVIDALSKVENGTERDALSMQLFGKSAMDMAGVIDDGGASLKQLGDEAQAAGLILSQDALDSANQFNDGLDTLKAKAQQSFLKVGATLAEKLLPKLEKLVETVSGIIEWFANLDGGTQTFILTMLALVAAISPILGIISTMTGLAAALNVAMLPMIATIGGIILAVAAVVAIGIALYKNWDTIKEKAGEVWTAICDFAVNAWNGLVATWNGIGDFFGGIWDGIKKKASSLWEGITSIFTNAIDTIKGLFSFEFKWPHIPLPHFSISGSINPLDWLKDGMPSIGVDWYAKAMNQPYTFTEPTIIGVGEAGSETVVGTDWLKKHTNGNITINVYASPGMDEDTLVKKMMRQINQELGRAI